VTTTYCLGGFARSLAKAKRTSEAWRALLGQMPKECDRDCTPGGCRAHCAAYAATQWKAAENKAALESAAQMNKESKRKRR